MRQGAAERLQLWVGLLALLTISFLHAPPSGAAPPDQTKVARLTVHASQGGPKISPLLYGIFFEEINRAGEGGLWSEMIQNRSFEDDRNEPVAWKFSGPVKASLDRQRPLYRQNPTSLRLEFSGPDAGATQDGFSRDKDRYPGGMAFRKGEALRFSLYQRGDCPLEVRLTGQGGRVLAQTSLPAPDSAWGKVEVTLEPSATDLSGKLALTGKGAGQVWIDQLSLMPVSTWKGHGLRRDLAEMIAALKPAFVRFPGGCFVEGLDLANAPRWKDSIGEPAQRRGIANRWGYQTSGAFGVHEFLQWCEDLGAEPLYVINCGMGHNYTVPINRMKEWVQDAVDLVEYARGAVDSKWGAMRAAAGHPAPFRLNYLEIGNENGGPEYAERYALFHDALKAKYPDLHLVANFWDGDVPKSRPVEIQDEHYYLDAVGFLGMADYYQRVDRNGPNVYVGEYAVTNGAGNGNLSAALGEAAFLTGLEATGDHVVMASYAPLLAHPAWKAWSPNAIVFDQGRAYGTPSYHLQTMFASNRGDVACPVELKQPEIPFEAPKGRFGVGTWGDTQVEYKDISFTAPDGKRIFTSDFTQGMKGWKPFKGVWTVQDGVLRHAGKEDAFELAQNRRQPLERWCLRGKGAQGGRRRRIPDPVSGRGRRPAASLERGRLGQHPDRAAGDLGRAENSGKSRNGPLVQHPHRTSGASHQVFSRRETDTGSGPSEPAMAVRGGQPDPGRQAHRPQAGQRRPGPAQDHVRHRRRDVGCFSGPGDGDDFE